MAVAVFEPIRPKQLNEKAFRLAALNGMRKVGGKMKRDFQRTTQTWEGEKPTFDSAIGISKEGPLLVVGPSGSTLGALKWMWLDQGTRIRYATMSRDWKSKTKPGRIGANKGQGRKLYVNRQQPRSGIEARNWIGILSKKWETKFSEEMQKALNKAAADSGHGIKK